MTYSKEVMKNFMHPKNMGEIKDADAVGKLGNPQCGDIMWVYIKVGKNKKGQEILKDVKFKTFGCAAAIATSSMITQLAKGKTLEEAEKITYNDIKNELNGLPPEKIHCSVMADRVLREAIKNYREKEIASTLSPSEKREAIKNYREKNDN